MSREAVRTGPNLVSTTNGRLLVWSPDGQGQIRDNTGHWSPVLQLGAPEIRAAVADPEGFLLLRHGPGVEVLLLDSAGTKRASWTADVRDDVSLASRPGGRWLLTNRVLIPLLPRSTLGPCEPLPQSIVSRVNPDVPFPPVPPPDLLDDRNGARLVCLPRSPYADGYGDGLCERTGPGGWRVPHRLEGPVVLCGDWILQAGENTVVLRSAQTGQVRATKHVDVAGQVSCAGTDRVAVGGKKVTILSLPSLEVAYQQKVERGRVASLAFTGGAVAYTTDGASGVDLVSLGCASSLEGRQHGKASP